MGFSSVSATKVKHLAKIRSPCQQRCEHKHRVFSLGCKQRFLPFLVQFCHHWREANETMWPIFGAKPKPRDRSVPNNSESWVQVKSNRSHAKRSCHLCSSKTLQLLLSSLETAPRRRCDMQKNQGKQIFFTG